MFIISKKSVFAKTILLILGIILLVGCEEREKKILHGEIPKFINAEINIPSIKFSRNITFNPSKFAKISIDESRKKGRSYQIYVHTLLDEENNKVVNALLFRKSRDGKYLYLVGDNLTDLHNESRALVPAGSSIRIIVKNVRQVKTLKLDYAQSSTTVQNEVFTIKYYNSVGKFPTDTCQTCCN